nr:Pr6Pr family membrane protein [Jiangella mangrovi]
MIIAACVIIQLVISIQGNDVLLIDEGDEAPGTARRVVNFFSFFTVQSNILLGIGAAILVRNPQADGRAFRVLRIAGLIGITVTGIVYVTLLRDLVDLEGIRAVTNVGFHYLAPVLGFFGWLLFGPWRRLDLRTVVLSLIWPVAWLVYTLIRGEVIDWYPYPFIDVTEHGYGRVLLNSAGITLIFLALGWLFLFGDRRLGDRAGSHPADDLPRAR